MANETMYFAFANESGEIVPQLFTNPKQMIVANTIDEVLDCMQKVEQAVAQGDYAAGYVSYEAAPAFNSAMKVNEHPTMPLFVFGIFEKPVTEQLKSDEAFTIWTVGEDTTRAQYDEDIGTIHEAIERGDTYQTNYTIRLHAKSNGNPVALFQEMQHAQQAKYTAYLHVADHQIVSASPELFFHLKDGVITTRPMKGTVKRGRYHEEDEQLASMLYHSEKNRAENVMIVDLLRNDLGQIAETDTVTVERLFDIEQYPTVHQMTSTIKAKISSDQTITDVFRALFPCGSITGAPKISTMEIICQLEHSPRNVYCGAIGFITPEKEAVFNVPIRTAVIHNGDVTYGVGGGITWDSTALAEYDELLAKSQVLTRKTPSFSMLESLLLENECYFLYDEHIARLKRAALYFNKPLPLEEIQQALAVEAKGKMGKHKVRLVVGNSVHVESQPIQEMVEPILVSLADAPIDSNDIFLFHKTTNRSVYDMHEVPNGCFDVLLFNEKEEVTEFKNGNIVYEMNGKRYTPPITCGLLAGTYRELLLRSKQVEERVLLKGELSQCTAVYFVNSVRKMLRVKFI